MIARSFKLAAIASVWSLLAAANVVRPTASPVADAAMRGDVASLRSLIAKRADVNAAQGDGMTALHWAADRGDSAMTSELLRAKANVQARTRIGSYTPLHIASRTGNPAVVRALLAAHSDVKATTASGATALHFAAAAGNAEVVKALLDRGADPNAREGSWGQTPLIFAAEYGRAAAIRALMAKGADPSIRTRIENLTDGAAREQAAEKRRRAVLISFEPPARHDSAESDFKRALDAAKAAAKANAPRTAADSANPQAGGGRANQLPVREPRGPFTPAQIQAAIDSGRAVMLMEKLPVDSVKENVDTLNGGVAGYAKQVGGVGGLTALHHAVRQGNVDAAMALVDDGANINDSSLVDGTTPLLLAIINGQFDVAIRLVERGANPNLTSASGMTPLYATINSQWAPRSRFPQPQAIQTQQTTHLELLEALLNKGADVNVRLKKQPWYFAYNNCGNPNCGLEVIDGTTAFWRATYALDLDAMKLLIKHGADPKLASVPPAPPARPTRPATTAANPASSTTATTAATATPAATATTAKTATIATPATTVAPATAATTAATATATTPKDSAARPAPSGRGANGAAADQPGLGGGVQFKLDPDIEVLAKAAPVGPGVLPIHAAAGVGYGNGFAGNAHRHAPDAWMPVMKYLVEELHVDVNARDNNGYTALHGAAARGDNEMIQYLVAHGADVKAVSRTGRTVVDMANGPVQRLRPFPETIALLEKLGAKNQHHCVSC
ncbi:MAG: ankyrin repeat domain-containing protein [Gemmatimonadaceae bacterium]